MEVRETDVSTPNISPCARDPEIQHTGLQTEDGAIPKGHQEGQASTEDAETERVCLQPGRRKSE